MYKKTTLNNQLRVVTNEMKQRDSVAIGLWADVGGRYEEDRIKGAAHFLEHIVFKGSKKYSCEQIKEQIEGVGGSLNAFTSEEQTCFYAKIPARHIKRTLDILADMVFFPQIKQEDVEKERTVILEELKMYRDLPQYYVIELLDGLMWPDHPLGKQLAGTAQSVGGMSLEDLNFFHQTHYSAGNIVVAAAGNLKHMAFVDLVKEKLSGVKTGPKHDFLKADNSQEHPRVNLFRKDTEQMHLSFGTLGLENEHKDRYVQNLLHVIMGGNLSSRLFAEVREKRGLAYSIGSGVKYLKDTGMFTIRAGVDNSKIEEAMKVILAELDKVKKKGVTKDELKRAKDYYLGQVLLTLEDSLDHMLWIGESILDRDKVITLKEIIKRVNKVTLADITRVANVILNPKRFNLALIGPLQDSQEKALRSLVGV